MTAFIGVCNIVHTDEIANILHRLSYDHVPKRLLEHVMITVITVDYIQYSAVLQ